MSEQPQGISNSSTTKDNSESANDDEFEHIHNDDDDMVDEEKSEQMAIGQAQMDELLKLLLGKAGMLGSSMFGQDDDASPDTDNSIDHSAPEVRERNLDRIADLIKSGKAKHIGFLTGAGVSVAAGIPDFRSPGGMYDTLRPDLLTATEEQRRCMSFDPTAVVSCQIFEANQFPYHELRRPFILSTGTEKWKPTIAHMFMKMCSDKGLLQRVYTQNIDGLDYGTGLDREKIIPVHGSIAICKCHFCDAEMDFAEYQNKVRTHIKDIYGQDDQAPKESKLMICDKCGRPGWKPNTVLYGGSLPEEFFDYSSVDTPKMDLLIVAGSSLVVGPANQLPMMVDRSCARALFNLEKVGAGFKFNQRESRDVFVQGPCDESFYALIQKLGWQDELEKALPNLAPSCAEVVKKFKESVA